MTSAKVILYWWRCLLLTIIKTIIKTKIYSENFSDDIAIFPTKDEK